MEYGDGIGVYIWGTTITVAGNAFINNTADGEYYYGGGDLYLENDWDGDGIGSIVNLFNNNFDSLYTQVGDNLMQVDNISGDPLLTGDYHLKTSSLCIEAGNNDAPGLPGIDMDGNARVINGDNTGDVDGSDLAELVANPALLDLSTFAAEFGRTNCPQT